MHSRIEPGAPWQHHPPTYRTAEIRLLTKWILAGASGSVLGLRGAGRSNLLGFLCHRPDVLRTYINPVKLPVTLVLVDLGDLPTNTLGDLYRVILRAFYEAQARFAEDAKQVVAQTYTEHQALTDPFLTQSALRKVLFHFQDTGHRIVLVIDRFDSFSRMLTPEMAQTLNSLRDTFRDTLSYIVGIRQSLTYLADIDLPADLYRLLTTHVCQLGPLNATDANFLIQRRTQVCDTPPSAEEAQAMLILTGGYPTLLEAVCRWWLIEVDPPAPAEWLPHLAAAPAMQHRLQGIWSGLTQEEQLTLTELVRGRLTLQTTPTPMQQWHAHVLRNLSAKGICHQQAGHWAVFGTLFADYIAQVGGMSRGRIWLDPTTDTLHHGLIVLDTLTAKESAVLRFLVGHPGVCHNYTEIIVNVWSDEENYNGVTNESLFQIIKGLRRKIEPNAAQPVYVVNWRGKPEGGYIFYPEGRPL